MGKATDYPSAKFVKIMFIGASGAGKTGALAPLLKDGYKLKFLEFDNGLDALINIARAMNPKYLEQIEYQTFRDKIKMTSQGTKTDGPPRAYANALSALEKWPDDQSNPAEWGPDVVLAIDSLTNLGRAAFLWAKAIDPANKDPRRWYKTAQDLIDDLLANVTSDAFRTNVVVISHVELTDMKDGTVKGYPSAIGQALGPKIGRYFNTLLLSETVGQGKNVKRKIKTVPTALIDVKNPAPMHIDAEYNIEDGMSLIFKKLKG
jgi:hypothetical protein